MGNDVLIRETRGESEYSELVRIWRTAVDATHDFLAESHKTQIEQSMAAEYLPNVHVVVAEREGVPVGFAGTDSGKLEMLFVDAGCRGGGIGTKLLEHVIAEHGVTTVDVNEQNEQAARFYAHAGFSVSNRSPNDDAGRPYPLLRMTLTR